MRLTNQVLRSRSERPLSTVEYLDLSNLGIVSLGERLSSCTNVEMLILSGNKLQDASGLDVCQQLWHLDLSGNRLQSVEGLSRFLALGTLLLSDNDLNWPDLAHLTHLHILSLSLHGNQQLERDPYYRIHVIDCLPNVWMLDGRIVTSAERIQVHQFFQDSALTERPVRHKLKKDSFVPSTLKTIEIDGVFGRKAVEMMTSFPKNGVLNIEMDWKRLQYLAKDFQDDINMLWKYTRRKTGGQYAPKQTLLVDLFEARQKHAERCNMVLLLLVASLDFLFPTHLVRDTLETGKLLTIGNVQTMDVFLLPRALRCKVVSLLVSAVKVDREQNEDGGLYTKLYLCLYHMMSELTKLSERSTAVIPLDLDSRFAEQLRDYKCLLATEVVQLMCIVPSFFDYLDRDIGVMNLVRIATADPDINEKLSQICGTRSQEGEDKEKRQNDVFKMMADFLLMKVQEQLQNLTNKPTIMTPCDRILSKSGALPMKGNKTPACKAEYLSKGVGTPDDDPPAVNPRKMSAKTRTKFPHLGDRMLLGPQTVGKIISLPQPTMALVMIDAVPVSSGAVEHRLKESDGHFTFVNMDQLEWDTQFSMWKPKGTVGDKFTLQAAEDFNREAGLSHREDTYRPSTPENTELQVVRDSTPLIYTHTPRQHVFIPTESAPTQKPRARRPQRPLSSVYKERLKLSLDLSRRAKSAGARRPFTVVYGSKSSTPKSQRGSSVVVDPLTGMRVDLKGVLDNSPSNPASSSRTGVANPASFRSQRSARHPPPVASSTPKLVKGDRNEKENKPPSGEPGDPASPEPKPSSGDQGAGEGSNPTENEGSAPAVHEEGDEEKAGDVPSKDKGQEELKEGDSREVFLTALSESPRAFAKSYSGKNQLAGRSRPVSAIERQQMFLKKPTDVFHTEFQQQRVDAWKQATRPSSQLAYATATAAAAAEPPPPQPPSSPIPPTHEAEVHLDKLSNDGSYDTICTINIHHPFSDRFVLERRVPKSNLWLAGGRDLFWEKLKSRPKSGHTPGWKEGLPESMKRRPKSAAAMMNRLPKTSAPPTPIPTRKEPVMHDTNLNNLVHFPDERQYPGSPHSYTMTKRYNSQRSLYEEDPLPGPLAENVYSPLKVLSYQRQFGYPNNSSCLPCLYEHYLDELDYESYYTPTCNTPTQD